MTLTAAALLNVDLADALALTETGAALLATGGSDLAAVAFVELFTIRDPYARTVAVAEALCLSDLVTVERVSGPAEEMDAVPVEILIRGLPVARGAAREAHVDPALSPREVAWVLAGALAEVGE